MQASCQSGPVVNPVVPCSQLIPTPPAGGAIAGPPPPPPAIVLALSAWGQLKMPTPVPSRYPSGTLPQDGHPYTVVKANTWFWTDAATWQPVSKTVTAGAVWGRATATPVTLSFTPGDGSAPVSCPGPGSEWKPTEQTWLAPVNAQGCVQIRQVESGRRRRRPGHGGLHDHLERHLGRFGRHERCLQWHADVDDVQIRGGRGADRGNPLAVADREVREAASCGGCTMRPTAGRPLVRAEQLLGSRLRRPSGRLL